MGIWRRSGCCRGGFCEDRRAPRTADDSGGLAAAALDGLIGDWSVMSCERWQAPGSNDRDAGNGMFWRTDAARRREGRSSRVPGFTAVFFRRTTPQITNPGGLWDETQHFYPRLGGIPHLRAHEWRWPRGGK